MANDRSPEPLPDHDAAARRARTLVIRWWRDSRDGRPRGTVRDLASGQLGAFDGFDALVALLRRQQG